MNKRRYTSVERGIQKVEFLNPQTNIWESPKRNGQFYARRFDLDLNRRVCATFETLEQARTWLLNSKILSPRATTKTIKEINLKLEDIKYRSEYEEKNARKRDWYHRNAAENARKNRFNRYKREPNRYITALRTDLAKGRIELDEFTRCVSEAVKWSLDGASGKKKNE